MQDPDDLVSFADEEDSRRDAVSSTERWPILIIDDEEQVHKATRFALADVDFLGRPLEFFSAYSAQEARDMLLNGPEFACILLDVVMESEHAGLEFVSFIRETFGDLNTRIILRTGQPGYAPEVEVIQKYDINDYKSKSELTRNRLITSVTAAVRSYQQIKTIEANRQGLELIIGASSDLLKVRAIRTFARGVLMQLCSLLRIDEDGFICCHYQSGSSEPVRVLAASGQYAECVGTAVEELSDALVRKDIATVLARKESLFEPDRMVLYIASPRGDELIVHVYTRQPIGELDRKLIEVFSINIAVGFDNARLFEHIESLAYVDQLTGLPNRSAFIRELNHRIELGDPLSVVIADIDNFEAVNDGLGHEIGDQTLQATVALVRRFFGENTYPARISSDSFGLILTQTDAEEIDKLLSAFQTEAREGLTVQGNEIPLSLTLGVARYSEHGTTGELLAQNAGIALKQAKRSHRASYCYFDAQFEQTLQRRLDIARELRHCIDRDELFLMYQPQITLSPRQLTGAEALLRWRRNGQYTVSPLEFIPVAEDSGHIVGIGEWVLEQACRQQLKWESELGRSLRMAVNVSIRQLRDPEFLSMLDDVLKRTSVNPANIELEITESMMMADQQLLGVLLGEIRQRGILVAVDDFGTGYSSLSYLQQLPVDRLKIDQSFVEGLDRRAEDRVIAALVVETGHLLSLRVIAEGVETQAHETHLRQLGCDEVQGYYYSRPLVAADFETFMMQFDNG